MVEMRGIELFLSVYTHLTGIIFYRYYVSITCIGFFIY